MFYSNVAWTLLSAYLKTTIVPFDKRDPRADNLAETEPFLHSPTAFMADTKLLIKKSSWRGEYQGNGLESHLEFVEQIAIFIHPKQALIE